MLKKAAFFLLGLLLIGFFSLWLLLTIQEGPITLAQRPIEQARLAQKTLSQQAGSELGNSENRRCQNYQPLRQALFGDLHLHTTYSQDASTQGTRNTPFDAYRFAKGEKLGLQPYNEQGEPQRWAQLQKPLDFAAVTDHAEQFGEVRSCSQQGLPGYDSTMCEIYRTWPRVAFFMMNTQANAGFTEGRFGFCGEDGKHCLAAAKTVWDEIQLAAKLHNDQTNDCRFTSFVGYEWTGTQEVANLHRNVIFKTETVPDMPVSFYEARTPQTLWDLLDVACLPEQGCDYLIIPHNSNLSDGFMFPSLGQQQWTAELAKRYQQREPLMEIMQHKGSSECYYGADSPLAKDEHCAFEQLPYGRFSGKYLPHTNKGVSPKAGFFRDTLREGINIQKSVGVNPYALGVIASTDSHLGTPGYVEEKSFQGHGGAGVPASTESMAGLPDDIEFGPGGLAVVWAEENTRESIFAAMQRRETYGTSGPRFTLRTFVGEAIKPGLCDQQDWLAQANKLGVPMGAEFSVTASESPGFLVAAQRDPDSETGLQQLQMIKVWLDENGEPQEKIWTIAGDANNGASVNLRSCQPQGESYQQLCTVWQDPQFDASLHAAYYVRALENPVCRWHTRICNAANVDCSAPDELDPGLQNCCNSNYPKTIQERAWSSPNWLKTD